MTSMEDPGPPAAPGSRPGPPTRPHPAGPPSGTRDGQAGRLFSRVVRLPDGLDPLALTGDHGFVWCAPTGALVGVGQAARVPVATGPGRIERAAETVAALLEAAEVVDPDGGGVGPAAVGALPFHPGTPGELVVPELLVRIDASGRGWAVLTGPAPAEGTSAADLVARLRAAPGDDRPWPRARRLDEGLWTTDAASPPAGLPSHAGAPQSGGSGSGTPAGSHGPPGPGGLARPGGPAGLGWRPGGGGFWRPWRRSGTGGWTRWCWPGRRPWRPRPHGPGPRCCGGCGGGLGG